MPEKVIFLHVGAPKTATSAIHNGLKVEPEINREANLYYPSYLDASFSFPHKNYISTGNSNAIAYVMRFGKDAIYENFEHESIFYIYLDLISAE